MAGQVPRHAQIEPARDDELELQRRAGKYTLDSVKKSES